MEVTRSRIGNILTRTCGYLKTVTSHSAQPYQGCAFGKSLCGAGCYVQHNVYLTRGRAWGDFLEVRVNAAESYLRNRRRERDWARRSRGMFSVFLSSATDPFPPQERRFGVTRGLLEAMAERPPDQLVVQTHTHQVGRFLDLLKSLSERCRLRVHLSVESDMERLPPLPPPPSSVDDRLRAASALRSAGIRTVVTVSPLLPIRDPERFFDRLATCADAVVIDHFIGGDGSRNGARTKLTPLPAAMERILRGSSLLDYRDRMVRVAEGRMPGRVGVGIDGFAGRFRIPALTGSDATR